MESAWTILMGLGLVVALGLAVWLFSTIGASRELESKRQKRKQ